MMDDVFTRALACLRAPDPAAKCALARCLLTHWTAGSLSLEAPPDLPDLEQPGRPPQPRLVPPRELPKRGMGTVEGRAALIHAVAHIELNAIDLAMDAVFRFRGLPAAFYGDWIRVAAEEARHFGLVRERLRRLGCDYGSFPAHDGLWSLARDTGYDPVARMALIPRFMEARGLDVTPGMIERFCAAGDHDTAEALNVILRDEVRHVRAGSRWLRFLCGQRGLNPEATYFGLLDKHLGTAVRCPLDHQARRRAGFTEAELHRLEALCAGS